MATRVNTKVVWGIVIGVVLALGAVGALWFLQSRKDPTRYARAAEKLAEAGEYEQAWTQYRGALGLDPANLEYIEKAEEALTSFVPQTPTEAAEYYHEHFIPLLNQKAQHYPDDLDAHLRMLRELMLRSKVMGTPAAWELAEQGASTMVNRLVSENDVRRHVQVYLAHFQLRNSQRFTTDELRTNYDDPEREDDLTDLVAKLPDNDLAQFTQVWAGLLLAEQLERNNQPSAAAEQFEKSRADLARALEAVPDGPEVARIQLVFLARDRQNEISSEGASSITQEQIDEGVERVLRLAGESDDHRLIADAVDVVLQVGGFTGGQLAADTLEAYLERHPENLTLAYSTARLLMQLQDMDVADEYASRIIDTPRSGVGLNSWIYDDIQRSTLALKGKIAFDRWETAPDEEAKSEALARLDEIQTKLSARVTSQTDPSLLQVEGMVAYANQNYLDAASKFEDAIQSSQSPSEELLVMAGAALDRIGQVGIAIDRFRSAAAMQPGNTAILARLARLQLRARRATDARLTIERIRSIDGETELWNELTRIADAQERIAESGLDPVAQAIVSAQRAYEEDDVDGARGTLESVIAQVPNDFRPYEALIRFEVSAGTPETVQAAIDRALAALPDNTRLKQFQALVNTEDPIERTEAMIAAGTTDPVVQAVQSARALETLKNQNESRIEILTRRGDTEGAAELTEIVDRADQRIAALIEQAEQLDPDSHDLLRLHLDIAMTEEDWARVESLLVRASEENLDQADGMLLEGQYRMRRGRPEDLETAVRTLRDAAARFEFSASARRMLGRAYEEVGNTRDAMAAYEEAYRLNPIDIATIRAYVTLLLRVGDETRARVVMEEARRVAPADPTMRERWLTLEQRAGNLDRVLDTRLRVYAANPYDRTNALALARFLGERTPDRGLIEAWLRSMGVQDRSALSDQAWRRMPVSQRNELIASTDADWNAMADEILTQVSRRVGDPFEPQLVRAEIMRRNGRAAEAETQLRAYIDERENDWERLELMLRMGRYQTSIGRYGSAAETLRAAQELQSETGREADRALADLYLARGAPSEAITLLEPIWQGGRDPQIGARVFEARLALDELDAAEAVLDEFEGATGVERSLELHCRSRLLARRVQDAYASGNARQGSTLLAQHRRVLEEYMQAAPNDVRPHIMLARSQYNEYQRTADAALLQNALLTLERADSVQAGAPDARGLRAAILLQRDDRRGAMVEMRRAVESAPDNEPLRAQYIELLAGIDVQQAIAAAQEGIDRDPGLPRWHEMLGDLQATLDADQAAKAYDDAYAIQPTPVLLAKWSQVQLSSDPPRYQAVLTRVDEAPFDLDANPGIRCLRAVALNSLGRRDEALAAVRRAHESFEAQREQAGGDIRTQAWFTALRRIYPVGQTAELESFVMQTIGRELTGQESRLMAQVWVAEGEAGYARSIEFQEQAIDLLAEAPVDLRLTLLGELGSYHVVAENYQQALDAFEAMIEIDRDHAQALNNAAYLLAEYLDGPDNAVQYAERANVLSPGDANILDTLGWAYYKAGRLREARDALLSSRDIQESAAALYHLAKVQVAEGNHAGARTSLERASVLGPDSATRAKIMALTDEINSRSASGGTH